MVGLRTNRLDEAEKTLQDQSLNTANSVLKASDTCCAISTDTSIEEEGKAALFSALKIYETAAVDAFNTLKSKIDILDKEKKVYYDIQVALSKLAKPANSLQECIIQRVPVADIIKAKETSTKIDEGLKEVSNTFKVSEEDHELEQK